MALSLGQSAPHFSLPSTSGTDFSFEKIANKACVLYFYPKDFTPGCSKEACDFRDHFDLFKNLDIDVFGISTDSLSTHLKFKNKYQLPFELLSDVEGKVSKLYKARIPILNLSKRVSYLLDKNHTIVAIYENMFGAEKHIRMMLEKINGQNH